MTSWNCSDLCDSGIDAALHDMINDLSVVFGMDVKEELGAMIEGRHETFKLFVNKIQSRMEEVKHDNDCDYSECDECNGYAVQVEDLENEVEQLREHPTLNWEGRTLEHRRNNVFVDIKTGDAFELTPSMELVSICQF